MAPQGESWCLIQSLSCLVARMSMTAMSGLPIGCRYEEAAAQGLVAGANAAAGGGVQLTMSRADSYIGVLVDDLTSRGTSEPYRMLTSRAEFRLSLRPDNADLRLTTLGTKAGLLSSSRAAAAERRRAAVAVAERAMAVVKLTSTAWRRHGFAVALDGRHYTAGEMLVHSGATVEAVFAAAASELCVADSPELECEGVGQSESTLRVQRNALTALQAACASDRSAVTTAAVQCFYRPYLARQERELTELRRDEDFALPKDLDFRGVSGLSAEDREKLTMAAPLSLAQARRVPGVTPAALVALMHHTKLKPRSTS